MKSNKVEGQVLKVRRNRTQKNTFSCFQSTIPRVFKIDHTTKKSKDIKLNSIEISFHTNHKKLYKCLLPNEMVFDEPRLIFSKNER